MTWSTKNLLAALADTDLVKSGDVSLEMVGSCIAATMHEHGDLPLVITVSEEQMMIESVLFPVSVVKDKHALNEEFLRTHQYLPLSAVAIQNIRGSEHYILFGALSASSTLENIQLEIITLADNVLSVAEACEDHIEHHPNAA